MIRKLLTYLLFLFAGGAVVFFIASKRLGDINSWLGFITAVVSIISLILQNSLSQQEQSSFRQQLISVLHHAEGITDSLSSIETTLRKNGGDPTLTAAIEAIRKSASALQMGLMETKVGGKQLSDDLDKSYKEWAQLELELRKLPLKHFIEDKSKERINGEVAKQGATSTLTGQ